MLLSSYPLCKPARKTHHALQDKPFLYEYEESQTMVPFIFLYTVAYDLDKLFSAPPVVWRNAGWIVIR